ncbi:hypothetical protein GOV06_05525 [Candidatus Woesearchaeota archaeon]|nr:hypothetical protein [Candidatus Woesearchaeota archaeon]
MAAKKDMKYVERENVTFVGLKILDPADQQQIKDIIYKDFITLERELKQIHGLKLHFKEYEKGGRRKYSVQMTIEAETGPITVNKLSSPVQWDPVAIVHKLLDKARQEIIHKYKTDSNFRKSYEKGGL